MYTKHNGDNAKLRIFSFIPQRQRIQPNFINRTYQTTKHTNTTRTTKTTTSTWISPLAQSLCSYNWDNANSEVLIFKLCKYRPISHISPSPICTVHRSRKTCTWLDEQFRTFHPSLHESVTTDIFMTKNHSRMSLYLLKRITVRNF